MTFTAFGAHHSNIPLFHEGSENLKLKKALYLSRIERDRNSEILNHN
jgi:hypothetical protein